MMVMKSFRANVIIYTLLLFASLSGLAYAVQQSEWYATSIGFVLLSVLWTILLIRYAEKWKKNLSQFIRHLQSKDFNVRYTDMSKKKEEYLQLFEEILNALKNVRIEKEFHYRYLQNVFEHVRIALICYDERDKIELINDAAYKMFSINRLLYLHHLNEIKPGFYKQIKDANIDNEGIIKLEVDGRIIPISIKSTSFYILGKKYCLVSFNDISTELDLQEMDSWKRLIKVLTHEIMNSVTPITSLTSALQNTIKEENLQEDDLKDIGSGLQTIEKRSKGLLKFVDLYRQFYRMPQPSVSHFKTASLINHIYTLMIQEMEKKRIAFETQILENTSLEADFDMIQQVIINLLVNSIEATGNTVSPMIQLETGKKEDKVFIAVIDNGKGISTEYHDQVFIPFFTTKQNGSGVGLSLSRQIVQLHRGTIELRSKEGKGTRVELLF